MAAVYPTLAAEKCGGSSRNLGPCAVLRGFSRYVAVLPGGFPANSKTNSKDSHPKTMAAVYPAPAVERCGGSSRNLRIRAVLRGFSR